MLQNWFVYCLRYTSEYQFAFFVGILGGIFGVLVDLDHIPSVFRGGIYPRLWHTPVLIISLFVACYCLAHLAGLLARMVLKI